VAVTEPTEAGIHDLTRVLHLADHFGIVFAFRWTGAVISCGVMAFPLMVRAIRLSIEAIDRKLGARGLRMILEDLMLDLMYHLPSQRRIREFVVTSDMVRTQQINWALFEKAG